MFERYTEKARRAIFFARYEASDYGSAFIESEHLLLGILREDKKTARLLVPKLGTREEIRAEIERHVTRGERLPTSIEIPLSKECRQALSIAADEANQLDHLHVGTEHLLLGLLRVGESLAGQVLFNRGAKIEDVLVELKKFPSNPQKQARSWAPISPTSFAEPGTPDAAVMLQRFLRMIRAGAVAEVRVFLTADAQFIDACGKRWAGEENLHKKVGELFAPFAARNAKFVIEETIQPRDGLWIATLLWEDVPLADKTPKGLCRMVVGLGREEQETSEWLIYSVQVTPVTRA